MTERTLRLATGLDYHLLEWGEPGAPLVVMVHGFLDLGWAWADVAERLAPRHHVIAPDLRGHGDSAWVGPGGYYHFMDYIADLDDLVAQVAGDAPIAIVGHSMGGTVSTYWAGTRPARCRRVATIEGLGPLDLPAALPARAATWIEGWRTARAKPPKVMASLDAAAARLCKHDPLLSLDAARGLAARGTRPVEGGVAWKHDPLHLTIGPYPFRRDHAAMFWQAIACPVLYIEGERSTFRLPEPELAWRLGQMRESRRTVIAGAGHAVARHRPVELAEVLLDFLA